MKFVPLFDQVLIKLVKVPEASKGGIFFPDSVRKKPDEGYIKEIGPDVTAVKKEDRIIFGKYVGVYLNIEGLGEDLVLIHQTDIIGKLEGR